MQKITGIGGIFFKAKDANLLTSWYKEHLGLEFAHGAVVFENDPPSPGATAFSIFKEESAYFSPSDKPFMINFRVKDLKALLEELKEKGVTMAGEMEEHEYGKFGWILDPENNKIELWEPVEEKP